MAGYQRILLAVDFNDDCEKLVERAAELARRYDAVLALIHMVEPVIVDPTYDVLPTLPAGYEQELIESSEARLNALAQSQGVSQGNCHVGVGATKAGIIAKAEEIGADLIVVGSHGRHGLSLLLGSTANAVLHSAPCDLLAVRIG